MNLGRLLCLVRGHQFSRWRTHANGNHPNRFALPLPPITTKPYRSRRCKRCGKTETAPLLAPVRKRAANAADTIQKEAP